jgi:hypothetical protein
MQKIAIFLFGAAFSSLAFPYDGVSCLNDAVKVYPQITNGIATKLCSNASSTEPVKCFVKASDIDSTITVGLSADLCSRSTNHVRTLLCYTDAAEQGFNRGQSVKLCTGSGSQEPSKCTANISKVDTGISRGIAVDVCSQTTNADKTIACYVKAASALNRGLAATLCGAKAVPLDY